LNVIVFCGTCQEVQKQTTKSLSQGTLCTSQGSNQTHPDYKSSELLLHQSAKSSLLLSSGTAVHCGLWPVKQCPSIFSYLPPTLSIYSLPALEDLFLLPLSILSWVFPFFLSLPVLEWRSFWISYSPTFSLGDLTILSFALLSILLHFLLCSSLLVLHSSNFSIPRFHI